MEINNNYTGIYVSQVNYKTNTISSPELSKSYRAEMDKVEISSQSVTNSSEVNASEYSAEEIAEFLKDKPYTAFKYEFYDTYAPDYAKTFIQNEIEHYYYEGFNPMRNTLVSYDKYAYTNNMTPEDIKSDLNKYNLLKRAAQINDGLYGFESVKKYREDYGINIIINVEDSYFNYFGFDTSIMYQDRKVNDNGEIMILPKNSDKWLTREEFIEICPDYEIFSTRDIAQEGSGKEYKLVLSCGEETYKKYAEDFIAGLSKEEIQILKDNDIFSSPAFVTTGIKGIEQFTKDIDEINTAEVRQWSGLNDRREELIQLAEEAKLRFAQKMSRSELKEGEIPSYENLYIVMPYYSGVSERDAKLIKELGLSDYIKIDTRQIDLEKGTIAGYRLDMDFINEYSECFYNPEKDPVKMQSLFYTNEEYDKMLSMYGSPKNIEKAYLYALDNNLSLDILSNDYTSAIGVEGGDYKELHSNLNGRDDFLEALFSKENNNTANQETNITINIELDLKSKYLSLLTKNNNIDTLLDII